MRNTETTLGKHFGQNSDAIVAQYQMMKKAREE